jgi:hypothetical protein
VKDRITLAFDESVTENDSVAVGTPLLLRGERTAVSIKFIFGGRLYCCLHGCLWRIRECESSKEKQALYSKSRQPQV